MNGHGAIVMRLYNGRADNGHDYHEHASVEQAKQEGHRLARTVDGDFVVYAPVAIIRRTQPTVEETVSIPGTQAEMDDDIPF